MRRGFVLAVKQVEHNEFLGRCGREYFRKRDN
jgi:hypothetical protein